MFYRRPAASIGLTISLISLIGLPLTAGFWAKFMVFAGTIAGRERDASSVVLAILMAFNAVIAADTIGACSASSLKRTKPRCHCECSDQACLLPTLFASS